MAKQVHQDVLDGGLNAIKSGATKLLLVSSFTIGDSLAAVTANKLAEVAVASGDFTIASTGSNRTLTSAAKSATATVGAAQGAALHFVFVDGERVLWATDETTKQAVTANNKVDFPALTYTSNQPT